MMLRRDMIRLAAGSAPALAVTHSPAAAQDAGRPVRVVVAYPAGGTPDILARLLAAGLTARLGQSVVVENRAGSSGIVGTESVSRAAPDGHTLMMGSVATHVMNAVMFRQIPYDPIGGFTPVALVAETPNVVIVNPALPVRTVADLVALARARPLSYGSTSIGGTPHMSGVLLENRAGFRMEHVPYRGSAPMLADLLGGHLPVAFDNLPASLGGIRDGSIRALAVTTAERSPILPEVPTVQEAGVAGYAVSSWFGVFGPPQLPAAVTARLEREVLAVFGQPEIRQRLLDLGASPLAGRRDALAARVASELALWREVVRASGIQPQ